MAIQPKVAMATGLGHREILDALPDRVKAHTFWSAKVSEMNVVKKLQSLSEEVNAGNLTRDEAIIKMQHMLGAVVPVVDGNGKITRWRLDDDQIGNQSIQNIASTARLDLIFSVQSRMANSVKQYQEGMDEMAMELFPYWRYRTRGDGKVRSEHAVLEGKIYKKNDPIWDKIFPPNGFRCRCYVEEVMEDEYQLEKEGNPDISKREEIPVESSGFKFNPRYAFSGFDLSSIDRDVIKFDEEELKRRELKENIYFGSMLRPTTNPTKRQKKREPERIVFETEPKTWKDFGLKSIDKIEPNEMPAKISVKDAEEKIEKGFDVEAKDGSVVHFGKELFHHWKNEKTEDFEQTKKDRLEDLNLAIQALENPVERWDKVNQHDYIGKFVKDGEVRYIFLTVDNSGNVRTFYANNINGINKTRKGLTYEDFK